MTKEWISTSKAVEITGYNEEYIRRLVRTRKVRARKFATVWQIDRRSLDQYLKSNRESADRRRGPKGLK
jgi:hypothetical protein